MRRVVNLNGRRTVVWFFNGRMFMPLWFWE
jgi:hypothetical protein